MTCASYVPGRDLPQDVCANCGGNRYNDHTPGQRSEAQHDKFSFSAPVPTITRDQAAQGVRPVWEGSFPLSVQYPCGCVATGNGGEQLPADCPTHGPAVRQVSPDLPAQEQANADRQPGEVSPEQPKNAKRRQKVGAEQPGGSGDGQA